MSEPPTTSESGPGPRRSTGRSRAGGEPSVREPATKADLVLLAPGRAQDLPAAWPHDAREAPGGRALHAVWPSRPRMIQATAWDSVRGRR